ncbi:MAG: prolipoprotein diacylglyceryl transferase [Desulfobulbaceae bacterium]|nr:prolipoprotein diacylglyceryl transferase [Desulfobulbaceae bacterium]
MLSFPSIDPVIFHIGPLQVRWYGMMYVLGFAASYFLVRFQIEKFKSQKLAAEFENLNFILIISLVLGGRLGYVLFYNFSYYLHNPMEILATWHGGMSFHGGVVGLILGGFLFCRKKGLNFLETADIYVVTTPVGLGLGRIGNFINGELFGRVSDVPWAMVFPGGGPLSRHPSQLYEAFMEGFLLFIILWHLKTVKYRKSWGHGTMLAAFLFFYGVFRIFIEFFRQPDAHIGYMAGFITRGQLLSSIMVCSGLILFFAVKNRLVIHQPINH